MPNGSTLTIATTTAPTTNPTTADAAVLTSQASTPADALDGVMDEILGVVDQSVRRVPAECVGADQQDVAADPEHRDRADGRQRRQQFGHRGDQAAADLLRET